MRAAIILAAGESSRLGQPKQLLRYRGKTLLRHAVDEAIASGAQPVVVVLGAAIEQVRAAVQEAPVCIVENKDWRAGIGASIGVGVRALLDRNPDAGATYLLLCDQPHVTTVVLQGMQSVAEETGKGIIACAYHDTLGVPLLVGRTYFDDLQSLPDGAGAKRLLAAHPEAVGQFPFPAGAIDIDQAEDLAHLERAK